MESLWLKFLISSASALFLVFAGWIKYMHTQIRKIVPKKDINEMILAALRPGEVRTKLIKEKLDRIEDKLDYAMEMLLDGYKRNNDRKTY